MTDSFLTWIRVGGLADSFDPWKVANEVEQIAEAAMWNVWASARKEYRATTTTDVEFAAADLIELRAAIQRHGAALHEIEVDASLYGPTDLSVWCSITPSYESSAIEFYLNGSNRIDVDAAANSIEASIAKFRRRKVWSGAKVTRTPTKVSSIADGETNASSSPVVKSRGLVSHVQRFMIRNRDEVIVSLVVGIVLSIGAAIVSALWPR